MNESIIDIINQQQALLKDLSKSLDTYQKAIAQIQESNEQILLSQ
jgi:hypothetical protein